MPTPSYPLPTTRAVGDGNPPADYNQLAADINDLNTRAPIVGTGVPDGAVTAPVGTFYIDKTVTNGVGLWWKANGAGNTGWVSTDYFNGFITDLNAAPLGRSFMFSDGTNIPPGYANAYHVLVETTLTPIGKYQRATQVGGGGFAIRSQNGSSAWSGWTVYSGGASVDTGWRRLALDNGWTGNLDVRRIGPLIYWRALGITGGTGPLLNTIPAAFRAADGLGTYVLGYSIASNALAWLRLGSTALDASANLSSSGAYTNFAPAPTAEAAPSGSLPGTGVG